MEAWRARICAILQQVFNIAASKKNRRGGKQPLLPIPASPCVARKQVLPPVGMGTFSVPNVTFDVRNGTRRASFERLTHLFQMPAPIRTKNCLFSVPPPVAHGEPPGSLGGVTALLSQKRFQYSANSVPVRVLVGSSLAESRGVPRRSLGGRQTGFGKDVDRRGSAPSVRRGCPRPGPASPASPRSDRPTRACPADA